MKIGRIALLVSAGLLAAVNAAMAGTMKVTLLGTGTPTPRLSNFSASTLVEAGPEKLLFDIGRGSTIRLFQKHVPLGAITAHFITHLHSDHIVAQRLGRDTLGFANLADGRVRSEGDGRDDGKPDQGFLGGYPHPRG